MSIGQSAHATTTGSDLVQQHLSAHFQRVDAYQYNPASIRVRIIDEQFRTLPRLERVDRIEPFLSDLPEELQQQIVFILPIASGEETDAGYLWLNREFELPE